SSVSVSRRFCPSLEATLKLLVEFFEPLLNILFVIRRQSSLIALFEHQDQHDYGELWHMRKTNTKRTTLTRSPRPRRESQLAQSSRPGNDRIRRRIGLDRVLQ